MLDLVSFSPFVSHEDTVNYLSFAAETAVAAFCFHGQWWALFLGLWVAFSAVKADITSLAEFLRDNIGLGDYTGVVDTVDSTLWIIVIATSVLTSQDIVNFTLSKLGNSVAENSLAQIIGFGTTIIDGIVLLAA